MNPFKGTGSGSLSHHFIRTIAPTGHLYTFEFHKERQLEAQKEFNIHQISNYVTAFHCDAYHDGFIKCPVLVNAVFLDLPNPWKAVSHAKAALKVCETIRLNISIKSFAFLRQTKLLGFVLFLLALNKFKPQSKNLL